MEEKYINRINKLKYYLLLLFIVIQPLLDIYYLYTDKVVNMFGFSPSTIIRVGITGLLVLLTLLTLKDKKSWIFIISYTIIVAMYTIFHLINAMNFKSLVPGDFNYSFISEVLYIIRLMIPLCIVFIASNIKITKNDFDYAIKIILILISGSIVISNILKISLSSYTNEVIKDNIFGWFTGAYEQYNYSSLASKGIFNFANQISALLVLLLLVMLAIYVRKNSRINLFIILTTIIAMIMLGTKVALFGAIIDIGIFICLILFMKLFKQENIFNKKIILMLVSSIMLIVILIGKSPALNREQVSHYVRVNNSNVEIQNPDVSEEYINSEESSNNINLEEPKDDIIEDNENIINEESNGENTVVGEIQENIVIQPDRDNEKSMISYIEKNYKNLMVNEQFITQSYPYQYDPDFWVDIINLPVEDRLNWRNLEQKMLQRVMDINDNPLDKWLGITFSRTQNIYNLERDFISQYYSIGILGILLLIGPYIILSLLSIIKMFMSFKEKFTLFNALSVCGILFLLGVSYYSGNVLDSLTVMIILSFILGKLIDNVLIKKLSKEV